MSVIAQTLGTARRSVAAALIGAALALGLFTIERFAYHHAIDAAHARVVAIEAVNAEVARLDEDLTHAALMVAATGDDGWARDYDAHLTQIYNAIERAKALAPAAVAQRYTQATGAANDQLVLLEDRAFALVEANRAAEALAILTGRDYQAAKATLTRGSEQLTQAIRAAAAREQQAVESRSLWLLLVLLACCGAGALWLWQLLAGNLRRGQSHYEAQDARIVELATRDPLTGLANRRLFQARASEWLADVGDGPQQLALMLIDLDHFKRINDRHGHGAGDQVLTEMARRLVAAAGPDALVARLGGDEFVIVCKIAADAPTAYMSAAQAILDRLSHPVDLYGEPAFLGGTIGIALAPSDGNDVDDLLRKADVALYRGKADGRAQISLFCPDMDAVLRERMDLERDMRSAIANREFVPHFQPLIDLESGAVTGFEALARWQHPTRGLLQPHQFLPLAEEAGLLGEMTLVILEEACRAAATWERPLTVAVNLAPAQLQDPWLPEKILHVLAETRLPTHRLEIELTENALIHDFETAKRVITFLKNKKVRVSLDDFGTGYSSLTHLSELPFDKIKIDQSFVRAAAENSDTLKIVAAIINLGRSLGLPTIAEGVENQDLAELLLKLGCTQAQGFHFSRPIPAGQAAAMARLLGAPAEGDRTSAAVA
jgi:diguanylate cyclase (GGDEF)-like protein